MRREDKINIDTLNSLYIIYYINLIFNMIYYYYYDIMKKMFEKKIL